MNIYIRIEVLARELEGRLLLGLVAAERGHDVLLGDLRSLLSHRHWLPPGILHDKALTPATHRIAAHRALRAAGFVITSQDEEHGLLQADYDTFARERFSEQSLEPAAAAFMWGPHDHAALRRIHPEYAGRIRLTGSPRVDGWRPEFAALHSSTPLPGVDRSKPYILIVGNTFLLGQNPFWVHMEDMRPTYFPAVLTGGPGFAASRSFEDSAFDSVGGDVAVLKALIPAIRAVLRDSDVQVVVRPHPTESARAWSALIGELPGLVVTRQGALSPWLRQAHAVIHNNSTTAFEAAIAAVPLISFQPEGVREASIANRLGRIARTGEELRQLIASADDELERERWFDEADRTIIDARFSHTTDRLAAEHLVDVWEELAADMPRPRAPRARPALVKGTLHRRIGSARMRARGEGRATFETAHKFPPLQRTEVDALVTGLRRTLDRFHEVKVDLVGKHLIRIRPGR